MPGYLFVAESGISKPEHVDYLRAVGVDAILVGESLMREKSPGQALLRLLGRDEEAQERMREAKPSRGDGRRFSSGG